MIRENTARVSMLCLVFLALTACEQLSGLLGSGPKDVLSKFLNASLHGQREEAYQYLSRRDQEVRTLAEYQRLEAEHPFLHAFMSKVSYTIQSVQVDGNTAKASVELRFPNFEGLFADLLGSAFMSALRGGPAKELEKTFQEKGAARDVPLTTQTKTYDLVKESGTWKVFLDWRTEIALRERTQAIETLLAEADALRKGNKLQAARAKYDAVLALDVTSEPAQHGRQQVEEALKAFETKQAYIKEYVKLRDFRTGQGQRFSVGAPEPGVFGTVVNHGERTLTKVQVVVYFLDEHGIVIGERDYHPVLVTTYASSANNTPLKPHYVRDFGYIIKDAAPSAYAGKAWAEVRDIEFAQ